MAFDDLAHARGLVDARHRGQQPHGPVEILGVLADDRDVEGAPVLDQHLPVRSNSTPRGARSASVR